MNSDKFRKWIVILGFVGIAAWMFQTRYWFTTTDGIVYMTNKWTGSTELLVRDSRMPVTPATE